MDKPLVKISYKLANGSQICVEVSTSVQELLEQSDRQIRSQRRQDRRHLDFKVSTDGNSDSPLLPTYARNVKRAMTYFFMGVIQYISIQFFFGIKKTLFRKRLFECFFSVLGYVTREK